VPGKPLETFTSLPQLQPAIIAAPVERMSEEPGDATMKALQDVATFGVESTRRFEGRESRKETLERIPVALGL
jgi:hypothetical protein